MPRFSDISLKRLATADERLQRIFATVIQRFDHAILEGHRDREAQDAAFARGQSKVHWPNSPHNSEPSRAIDAAPYPIDWKDRERFTLFAGYVLGVADGMGVKLRWGGDWDQDTQVKDNSFDDLCHFEIVADGDPPPRP